MKTNFAICEQSTTQGTGHQKMDNSSFVVQATDEFMESIHPNNNNTGEYHVEVDKIRNSTSSVAITSEFKKVYLKTYSREQMSYLHTLIKVTPTLRDSNVIQLYQLSEQNGEYQGVFEYMNDAAYLQTKVIEKSSMISNQLKLKSYLVDILEGLDYLHSQQLVHMNIQPNSLLAHRGNILRSIGKLETLSVYNSVIELSLLEYLQTELPIVPPELERGYRIEYSFDIWCLGVFLFQACTGLLPISRMEDNIKLLKRTVDEGLQEIIILTLNKNARERPSASELLESEWLSL